VLTSDVRRRFFPSMPQRLRLIPLVLALLALTCARTSGASATPAFSDRDDAQLVASKQIQFITYARLLLGVPYAYGGTSPASGFDCSGFTRYVYEHFGLELPHYSGAQYLLGRDVARGDLVPGDLVFFDGVGHVGLYLGGGMFIHAPHTGTSVSVDSLSGWYAENYDGARRIL
jgi:cell wall-associated NlpC family hydrolase